MSYSTDIARRTSGMPVRRETRQALVRLGGAVQVQQAVIRAKSCVGEFAMNEVVYLKSMQREVDQRNPDAADAVALIINTTISGIARDVAQFGSEV
jgi:hypothetical protein